jgi:hypothetical protein
MFTTSLFTIAKWSNEPRCPQTDEWIKKMWYIYTNKYYSAIKKKEIMSFAGKWAELGGQNKASLKSQISHLLLTCRIWF